MRGLFGPTLSDLLASAPVPVSTIAVDIPIGLPDTGARQADVLARRLLGSRASTLFVTPTRDAVEAPDRSEASRRNVQRGGQGVTAQAFALVPAILEAERFVTDNPRLRVVECHPECSFAEMNGGAPVAAPKRTWTGMQDRLRLLREAGIDLTAHDVGEAGVQAATDDVIDAAAAAWSARRCTEGVAFGLPETPERFDSGPRGAIWI